VKGSDGSGGLGAALTPARRSPPFVDHGHTPPSVQSAPQQSYGAAQVWPGTLQARHWIPTQRAP
jgi:hypothetical protein